jgi:hypothetical protein
MASVVFLMVQDKKDSDEDYDDDDLSPPAR